MSGKCQGKKSCQGKVSQNCSLLGEYLHLVGYLVADERVGEEQKMREKRKRTDLISGLEQQKRLKLD